MSIYTNKLILQADDCTQGGFSLFFFFAFGVGDERCFWVPNLGAPQFPGTPFGIHPRSSDPCLLLSSPPGRSPGHTQGTTREGFACDMGGS